MSNPVNWFEIATNDLERANKFYKTVFKIDTQFMDMPDSPMYMMMGEAGAPNAGGALVKSEGYTPNAEGTVVYFQCDDVANEESRVEPAGGKLLFPKMSLGEFGFIAQFIDTEGNRIGLHSMK